MAGVKRARSSSSSAAAGPRARKQYKKESGAPVKVGEGEDSSTFFRDEYPLTSGWTAINAGTPAAGKPFSQWTPKELGRLSNNSKESDNAAFKQLDDMDMDENLIPTEDTQRDDGDDIDDDDNGSDLDDELLPYTGADGKGRLIPIGPRTLAKVGVKDMSMLAMLTEYSTKHFLKELHFQNIVYAHIDWNKKSHITKINAWRNQVYGRANQTIKEVKMWHKDEETWIEIYHSLLLRYAKKYPLRMPQSKEVWGNFNNFFKGKVLVDKDGKTLLPPRGERQLTSFTSKVTRVCGKMKEQLDRLSKGELGGDYTPTIDQKMIDELKTIKATMFARLQQHGKIVMNHDTLQLHAVNVRRLKNVKHPKNGEQESLTAGEESALFADWNAFFEAIKLPEPPMALAGSDSDLSEVRENIRSRSPSPESRTFAPTESTEEPLGDGEQELDLDKDKIVEVIPSSKVTGPTEVVATTTTTLTQTTNVDVKGEVKEDALTEAEKTLTETRVTRASTDAGIEGEFSSMSVRALD
ncbi:hypothetical protein K491DRAFT_782252 [Lophiostoma macrostomum CBS 122681]|uniref:Uncharacterized protein n=1 Tax=Lophiostoma macrostomum CBS 122681 TaxID=1314788 RepID=A0A6A6ST17_9PLEO|nr:hypothetical protein K491DRAFT_782252 [Lophiostoma macrostomum CBS 122681]